MLVRQGDERDDDADRRLACILAGAAGSLNAAAFQAVGFFAANMTGNVSALSDHLARGNLVIGAFFFAIIGTFITGATLSTLLINRGRDRQMHAIYAYNIFAEALALAALALADPLLTPAARGPALILGLSFLMGLQNAVVTRISNARVRTTHVSGMITDIGIELGTLIDIARGRLPAEGRAGNRRKLRLHVFTVLSFLGGGILGVAAYRVSGPGMLLTVAGLLLGVSITGIRAARRRAAQPDGLGSPSV